MTKFKTTILSVVLCTCWFIGLGFFLINYGTHFGPHTYYSIFVQNPDKIGKPSVIRDTIFFNDNFFLTRPEVIIGPARLFYNKNPFILLWHFLGITVSSISMAFIWPLFKKVKDSISEMKRRRDAIWIILGAFLFAFFLSIFDNGNAHLMTPWDAMRNFQVILKYPLLTICLLAIPSFVVAVLCVSGLLLSAYNIYRLPEYVGNNDQIIYDYRRIRNNINYFLLILGLAVASASVITAAALRSALSNLFLGNSHIDFFPSQIVYIYSLTYALFITIVYVPVYFIMTSAGGTILEKINPFNVNHLGEWNQSKNILEEYLGLKATLKENLSAGLIVISPVVSGLVSQLISK